MVSSPGAGFSSVATDVGVSTHGSVSGTADDDGDGDADADGALDDALGAAVGDSARVPAIGACAPHATRATNAESAESGAMRRRSARAKEPAF